MRRSHQLRVTTVALAAAVAALPAAAQDLGWRPYYDDRYGFGLEYPAAIFSTAAFADAEGGIVLSSPDGMARLRITGGLNDMNLDPEGVADQLALTPDVATVTYRRVTPQWVVVSGYLNGGGASPGGIFYARVEYSPDRRFFSGFRMEYPESYRLLLDGAISRVGNSLTAPPAAGMF